jgi:predicted O-methyltransferase YrrM
MTDFSTLRVRYSIDDLFREYGNPGCDIQQKGSEFKVLLDRYIALQPKTVLEIGQWAGGTLYYWLKYAAPGAKIVCIDVTHDRAKASYQRWGMRPDVTVEFVTGRSDQTDVMEAVSLDYPRFDFAFIDGCHKFPTVRTDWEWYGRTATVCAMHDINFTPDNDVALLWREIREECATEEFIEVANPFSGSWWGIGVARPGVAPAQGVHA